MISFDQLLDEVSEYSSLLEVAVDQKFKFNQKEKIFLIDEGSLLAYGDKDPVTGIRATQTFGQHDPIGFAEAITGRAMRLNFRKLSDLRLRVFQSKEVKKQVNSAKIFSQTIIKYSLSRIFNQKRANPNYSFEDEFIAKNHGFFKRVRIARDDDIFRIKEQATKMFFIEKGAVGIFSKNKKQIAELGWGECFGESAMLSDLERRYTAVANKDSTLLLIDQATVEREMALDTPLVRLVVLVLLKRLELMNRLRMVKDRG